MMTTSTVGDHLKRHKQLKLNIACVQLRPVFKDVKRSMARAEHLISPLAPNDVDILVLPEMCFTGYGFKSFKEIQPFLETNDNGQSLNWGIQTGYPEEQKSGPSYCSESSNDDSFEKVTGYNALMIIYPDGSITSQHSSYQKHFMYETDKAWARPGPGFQYLDLEFPFPKPQYSTSSASSNQTFSEGRSGNSENVRPRHTDKCETLSSAQDDTNTATTRITRMTRRVRVCPCICMDLNPYDFTAPFEAYELSTFARQHGVELIICSMAWLDAEPHDPSTLSSSPSLSPSISPYSPKSQPSKSLDAKSPELVVTANTAEDVRVYHEGTFDSIEWANVRSTIAYWASRCGPMMGTGATFVACNRVGREEDAVFTGSSCVMKLDDPPRVLSYAPRRGEALLRATVEL